MNYKCNYCGNVYLKEREQCPTCGARDFSIGQKINPVYHSSWWSRSVLPSGGYTAGSLVSRLRPDGLDWVPDSPFPGDGLRVWDKVLGSRRGRKVIDDLIPPCGALGRI